MPFCPKCGKEVASDAKFCANCGNTLVAAAAPVTTTPSPGYAPPAPLADLGSRIVAGLVDYIIIVIIAGALLFLAIAPFMVLGPFRFMAVGWFLGLLGLQFFLWLIYFTYFEGTSGQTLGKNLVHIKVVKEDGSRCDFGSALVRNILRIVDHLPFLYLLGIILVAATDKRQRLGDMLAKTIVVKA